MKLIKSLFLITILLVTHYSNAQKFDNVTIKTTKVSENIYMLVGAGGNIGVSVSDTSVFVIDDQFAPLTEKITTAIKKLSNAPITYVANTHFHGDHSGGNVNMAKLGATIIAHDNVRKRLETTPKKDGTMQPKEALPVITFNDKMSLHINGEKVLIFHVDNAHTDGDAMLYFTESNVLHTGDTYFSGWYPFIDLKSGGSVDGYIEAVKLGLMVINDDTKIIPGHGKVSNKAEYSAYLKMLKELKSIILAEIKKGKTEDQVVGNKKLTKKFDAQGYSWNFISSEKIRRAFYKSLKK